MASYSEASVALSTPPTEDRNLVSISDPLLFERLGLVGFGGPEVTEHKAMTFAACYRAVSIIASSIAGLEFGVVRTGENGLKERIASPLDDPYRLHPEHDPVLTKFEWHELMFVWLLLHGNFFAMKLKNGAGVTTAWQPIHPRMVGVEWDSSYVGGKKYTVTDVHGQRFTGGSEKFLHIMGISLDGLVGVSVITAARLGIGIGLAGDEAGYQMFNRGSSVSGIVSPREGEELTDHDVQVIKRHINDSMTGAENTGTIGVINRRLDLMKWNMSAADAQFLESRTFQIDEIGRWFGIPSHLLNLSQKSTSWGPGIEQQNIGLAKYTLKPWTDRASSRLSLLVPRGHVAEYSYDSFLRPEPVIEQTALIAGIAGGLFTPNEARQKLNLPPIAGGDELRKAVTKNAENPDTGGSEPDTEIEEA